MDDIDKKIYKWVGFRLVPKYSGTDMTKTLWLYPEGVHNEDTPPIDANFIEKYIFPNLDYIEIKASIKVPWLSVMIRHEYKEYFGKGKTLAEAVKAALGEYFEAKR